MTRCLTSTPSRQIRLAPPLPPDLPPASSTTNGLPREASLQSSRPLPGIDIDIPPGVDTVNTVDIALCEYPALQPSSGPWRVDDSGVGAGPGPLRHPRPLTAAELHSQLEQEQELIVNRLSRDLTLLRRAQNSSVVSNASSTSASTSAIDPLYSSSFTDSHLLSGPGFPVPTSRRHHRTSSNASTRSLSLVANQGSSSSSVTMPGSFSGNAAVLEAARNPRGAASMSRQNSTTSHRSSSRNRSPQPYAGGSGALPSSYSQPHGLPESASTYFNRDRTSSNASIVATPGSDLSPGLLPATLRYEETIHYRNELEAAKRENEALKKRVKALEKLLRERRDSDSDHSRARSESISASSGVSMTGTIGVGGAIGGGTGIAGGRRDERRGTGRAADPASIAVGVPKTEVRVGESARTEGISLDSQQTESHDMK
ncbi:hypothetical protein CIB48_g10812 [Xylaria polymorpha]|nr:hypothetical protein CIB48_g10812 [Xylaria polymorpha]